MTDPQDPDQTPDRSTPEEAGLLDLPGPAPAGLSRREMMAVAIALLAGGTVTFALMAGSAPSKPVASGVEEAAIERPAPVLAGSNRPAPRWKNGDLEWLANPRRGAAFELYADSKVAIWERKAHPVLVVRCEKNRTESFVFIESAARIERQDDRHTVTLQFDDEVEAVERWPDSEEHDALFAPDGASFARRLTRSKTLRFGYTPHNAAPVVATFSIAGLADLMGPAASRCGWTTGLESRRK